MTGPTPIVRQLVLCHKVRYVLGRGYWLYRPFVDLMPESGHRFPLSCPELWLLTQVTASFGRQQFRVRMVEVTDPLAAPVTVFETADRAIDLGSPHGAFRLRSRTWSIRLEDVPFPNAGRFEFWMMCGAIPQAKASLFVEDAS